MALRDYLIQRIELEHWDQRKFVGSYGEVRAMTSPVLGECPTFAWVSSDPRFVLLSEEMHTFISSDHHGIQQYGKFMQAIDSAAGLVDLTSVIDLSKAAAFVEAPDRIAQLHEDVLDLVAVVAKTNLRDGVSLSDRAGIALRLGEAEDRIDELRKEFHNVYVALAMVRTSLQEEF